jgi:hypothetical protein
MHGKQLQIEMSKSARPAVPELIVAWPEQKLNDRHQRALPNFPIFLFERGKPPSTISISL